MKRKLVSKITAWLAAVSMIASPAGVNIAGIAVMAADEAAVTTSVETTENVSLPEETTASEETTVSETTAETTVPTEPSASEDTSVTTVPEETGEVETSGNETTGEVTTVPETDTSETDTSEETSVEDTDASEGEETSEETEETEEETDEEDTEPEVYHYVSPYSGEGLMQYEYYHIDYGEEDVIEGGISCVRAPSYYSAQSKFSSDDGYNALSSDLQDVYDSMYEALVTIDSSSAYSAPYDSNYKGYYFDEFKISDTVLDGNDIFKVFIAIRNDNPQFFWLGHGYLSGTSGSNTYIWFGVDDPASDYATGTKRMSVKNSIMAEVEEVLTNAELYGGNEYSKEWYIHNYLCESTDYVLNAAHAHDISGLLIDGKAVCESYAKCFQLFMNALNIDVLYVTGIGNGGGHAWNQIGLDNNGVTEWYNVDVTWDDEDNGYNYNYFNVVDSDGSAYDFTYGPYGDGGTNAHTPEQPSSDEYLYGVHTCNSETYSYANHNANYVPGSLVAMIGSKGYVSLDAAIAAVKTSGQTITLVDDAEYNGQTMPAYAMTIDGAGYGITFNSDMTLKANLTVKGVKGVAKSSVLPVFVIKTGAYTLTFGSGMVDYVNATIDGSGTGSLTFEASESEYLLSSVINLKNVTVPANVSVRTYSTVTGTNLTLGADSALASDTGSIEFANYKGDAASKLVLDAANACASFSGTITADVVNVYVAGIDYNVPVVKTTKNYSVDLFNVVDTSVEPDASHAVRKAIDSNGKYCYYPVASSDYTISDGTKTVKRATLEEAIDYIDEAAKTTATYTITYTGGEESINVSGADLNAAKAKEIIFEGASICVTDDITLKTNLTFNDGAAFNGNITTNTFVLKLTGKSDISAIVSSAANITVDGAYLCVNAEDGNVKFNNLVLKNGAVVYFENAAEVSVTKLTMSDGSSFDVDGNTAATIGSIVSTGGNVISTYSSVPVKLTGAVTLTDGTPIIFAATDDIAESGQVALTATSTAVKATSFTTYAKTAEGDNLSIVRVGNEIRYAAAVFSVDGLGSYALWEDALAAINAAGSANKEVTVTLLDDVTVDNLVLPAATKAESILFNGTGTLTLGNATLAMPINTSIACKVSAENMNITVAAGKTFTVNENLTVNNITGTATSNLCVIGNKKLTAAKISTFNNVTCTMENDSVSVSSGMSGVNYFDGTLYVTKANAVVTISNLSMDGKFYYTSENGVLPKVTVNNIPEGMNLTVNVDNGAALASGAIVLYTPKDFTGKVTIANKTSSGKTLTAIYYPATKAFKAEYAGLLTLSADGETINNYPNFEKAFEEITKRKNNSANYTITVIEDVSASAFTIPTYADSIKFVGKDGAKTITLNNLTAVTANVNLVFENITLESSKPFTFTANKTLSLTGFASESMTALKGNAKFVLEWGTNNTLSVPVSGFGTVTLMENAVMTTAATANFTKLIMEVNSKLIVPSASKITIKDIMAVPYSEIYYEDGFTPVSITGKAEGTVTFTGASRFTDGQLLFTSSAANLACFKVVEENWPDDTFDYTVSRTGSNVYLRSVKLVLSDGENVYKMATWADVISSINDANNKVAYTITLLGNYDIDGAMTMPKAGTYEALNITSANDANLTFVGTAITLTGNTLFTNVGVSALKKSGTDYVPAAYNITAGANGLWLTNVSGNITNITSTNNVFLDGTDVAGNVTAKNMLITNSAVMGNVTLTGNFTIGTNAVVGENLTADQITSLDSESSKLTLTYGKKFTIGKTGFANVEKLTVRFVETKGEEMCAEIAIGEEIGSITGDYYGNIVIDGSSLCVIRSGNKLVAGNTADMIKVTYVDFNSSGDWTNYELLFANLKDVMTEINRRNDPDVGYNVYINNDMTITGALPLPAAGKSGTIMFDTDNENGVTLSLTGDITMTGGLYFKKGVTVKKVNATTKADLPININVGKYELSVYEFINVNNVNGVQGKARFENSANISGTVNVNELTIGETVTLGNTASITANELYVTSDTVLVYPYKSAARVKIGTFNEYSDPLTVKLMDGEIEYAYPTDTIFDVMNITGDYEQGKVVLYNGTEYSVVSSGNKLVAGKTAKMMTLKYTTYDSQGTLIQVESLYASLKDVMTEITRIGDKNKLYDIYVSENQEITGALPLPAAGKYERVKFWASNDDGVTLSMTSDITLTGNLIIEEGVTVKKVNAKGDDLPINVNVGAYKFMMDESFKAGNINGVKGLAALFGDANISGTVNVNELTIGETVTLGNTASITANELNASGGAALVYPYKSAAKVKVGTFTGDPLTVKLMDGDEEYDYPTDTIFDVMNITGDYEQGKVKINGHDELSVVRSGNKLVAGNTADMIKLSNDGSLYASLKDIMTEINRRNKPDVAYAVYINNDMPITGALPLPATGKYDEIRFRTENANGVTLTLTGDITMTGDLYFAEGVTVKKVNDQPINVNVGAYNFFMNESFNAGNINGAKGFAALYCDANISGTVNADSLYIDGIITLGNTASITANYLDAFSDTVLVYPYKNAAKVKIGTFTGNPDSILTVKLMDGDEEYDYPTDTIFDVMNITGDYEHGRVVINGHDEYSVVRSGNKLVAGETAKMAKLDDGSLYASLKDVMTEINRRNDPDGWYTVYINNDMPITGALPLPAAGKYKRIYFQTDNANGVTLSLTGDITMTGDLYFDEGVTVKKVNAKGDDLPINVNVGAYNFWMNESFKAGNINGVKGFAALYCDANISGTVNVNELTIGETVTLGNTASITANELYAESGATLEYPYKSAAKVKIGTFTGDPLTVKLMDGDEEYDYPTDKVFDVMNITGNYAQDMVVINGHNELSVVRSGNKLVAGETAKMAKLADGSLYASLNDIMTEINRRNKPDVAYTVYISNDMTITGALPLPAAGKYSEIWFETENGNDVTLSLTGDITMTGELHFEKGVNVKKVNAKGDDLPININVGKYELWVQEFINVNNVNGAQGKIIFNNGAKINGTVNVNELSISGIVTLGNTASLTANEWYNSSGAALIYPYKSAAKVKVGTLTGYSLTVKLMDGEIQYNYPTDKTFDVMNITGDYVQGKVKINGHNELSVVRSGNKLVAGETADMIEINDGSLYASLKDVMTEINRRNDPDGWYTVYINNDMTITGALPLPAAGKYKEIDFRTENANGVTLSLTGDITMTGDLYFDEGVTVKKVNAKGDDLPINVNVGKYYFYAHEFINVNNVNGAQGDVGFGKDAKISGTVNVNRLYIYETVTLGNTASITANELYAESDTVLVYPYKNAARVKVGTFIGYPLTVKLMDGDEEYDYPTDKVFDVMNITGNYEQDMVVINGQSELSVVRSGNKLVAGKTADMIEINDGSLFANLKDVMTEITRRNDPDVAYTVYINNDMTITGALPLPAAGKSGTIMFETENENGVTLSLTGDITMTGRLYFKKGVNVKKVNAKGDDLPININVGKYELEVYDFINVNNVNGVQGTVHFANHANISGTVNVNRLYIYETVTLGNTASLTVNEWCNYVGATLEYPYKSAAKVKVGTFTGDPLTVKLMDGDEEYDYPTDKVFDVMNITGDYAKDMVVINGHDELSVVRSGNKLVAGNTDDMIKVTYGDFNSSGNWIDYEPLFANLKDVMTEINRRNDPDEVYTVYINNDMTITGALPLPAAGKYSEIWFETENGNGVTLSLTGDITMTGDLCFKKGVNVKKVNAKGDDLPININVGKYELYVQEFINVNNVNGVQGIARFKKGANISGTVNVNQLYINIAVTLGNTASITVNEWDNTSGAALIYPYKSAARVKIGTFDEYSDPLTVKLVDADGNLVTLTEADAGKVLMAKCGDISKITLRNDLPEGYVLATTSTGALTIAKSTT